MKLQRCNACGRAQYPPRQLCSFCLTDKLEWHDAEAGEVLAVTTLHHTHEPEFRSRLPLRIGVVRLDAGPSVVCFLADDCEAGTRVRVQGDAVLHARR